MGNGLVIALIGGGSLAIALGLFFVLRGCAILKTQLDLRGRAAAILAGKEPLDEKGLALVTEVRRFDWLDFGITHVLWVITLAGGIGCLTLGATGWMAEPTAYSVYSAQ